MNIGSKGLLKADLVIPQGTSLGFSIVHKDEDGNVVDHSGSTCYMVLQKKGGVEVADWSSYCTGSATGITVAIPDAATTSINPGTAMVWDLIVTDSGGASTRLIYGDAQVVDTYSLDS